MEKTLVSPLDIKEIKPVDPKGNQSWICIGVTDAKAEASIFWPSEAKSQFIGKDPDAWKDWGQEEKGVTEKMIGWHQWLNGYEFEQTLADSERQGSLLAVVHGVPELDMTEWLKKNCNKLHTLFLPLWFKNKATINPLSSPDLFLNHKFHQSKKKKKKKEKFISIDSVEEIGLHSIKCWTSLIYSASCLILNPKLLATCLVTDTF